MILTVCFSLEILEIEPARDEKTLGCIVYPEFGFKQIYRVTILKEEDALCTQANQNIQAGLKLTLK